MPIPLTYPDNVKGSFISPRLPPPAYSAPVFERLDDMGRNQRNRQLDWIGDTPRNHVIAMLGEFMGTTMFLLLALTAVQTANAKPDTLPRTDILSTSPSLLQITYIAAAFGLSLMVNVWVFFRISGGLFNPAVTIALALVGAVPVIRAALLIPVQLLAGIFASFLVSILFPGVMNVQTSLGSGTSTTQGMFIEMFLTAQLIFTILMLAVEKHRATPLAPLGIGAALSLATLLVCINWTGASLNPARSFGPAVILGNFLPEQWVYWLGPILGAVVAVGFYKLIKFLEYESANPGQDDDGLPYYRVVASQKMGVMAPRWSGSFSSLSPFAKAGRD